MITLGIVGPWQIILLLVTVLILILPLIAIIDILRHDFNCSDKLIWILVVLFLPILGSILYFIIGSSKKIMK
mgnify:CR=1 FL=1